MELLDEITKLRYESKLHKSVAGDTRNALIHTYRQYKGSKYVPSYVHQSIKWSETDPMLEPIRDDAEYKNIKQSKYSRTTQNESNKITEKKRNLEEDADTPAQLPKKARKIHKINTEKRNTEKRVEYYYILFVYVCLLSLCCSLPESSSLVP